MTFLATEKKNTVQEWLYKVIMNGVIDQHFVVYPCTSSYQNFKYV